MIIGLCWGNSGIGKARNSFAHNISVECNDTAHMESHEDLERSGAEYLDASATLDQDGPQKSNAISMASVISQAKRVRSPLKGPHSSKISKFTVFDDNINQNEEIDAEKNLVDDILCPTCGSPLNSSTKTDNQTAKLKENVQKLIKENRLLTATIKNQEDIIENYQQIVTRNNTAKGAKKPLSDQIKELKEVITKRDSSMIPREKQEFLMGDEFIQELINLPNFKSMCYKVMEHLWSRETRRSLYLNETKTKRPNSYRLVDAYEIQFVKRILKKASQHADMTPQKLDTFDDGKLITKWMSERCTRDRYAYSQKGK